MTDMRQLTPARPRLDDAGLAVFARGGSAMPQLRRLIAIARREAER